MDGQTDVFKYSCKYSIVCLPIDETFYFYICLYMAMIFKLLLSRLTTGKDTRKKTMIILMTSEQQNWPGTNTNSSMNPLLWHFFKASSSLQCSVLHVTRSPGPLRLSCICRYRLHPLVNVHCRYAGTREKQFLK